MSLIQKIFLYQAENFHLLQDEILPWFEKNKKKGEKKKRKKKTEVTTSSSQLKMKS